MNIKTIIIDDEIASRKVLANLILISHPEINIIGSYKNLKDGIKSIKQLKPDLVFLDIEMPQEDGTKIAEYFESINFQIVFITAYREYAVEAFNLKATDYLLKPIDRERLSESISRVKEKLTQLKLKQKITLTEASKQHIISVNDIIAIEAQGAYATYYLINYKKFTVSKNIGRIEKEMISFKNFFRSHKSWVINKQYVREIKKKEEIILLHDNIKAKLSRFKKNEFLSDFNTQNCS